MKIRRNLRTSAEPARPGRAWPILFALLLWLSFEQMPTAHAAAFNGAGGWPSVSAHRHITGDTALSIPPSALAATPAPAGRQAAHNNGPVLLAGGRYVQPLLLLAAVVLFIILVSAVVRHRFSSRRQRRDRQAADARVARATQQPEAHLKDLGDALARQTGTAQITKTKTTIGRDPRNDIVIKKPTISGLHAIIEYRHLAFYLEDQRSTNGTRLNNQKLQPNMSVRLKSGDRIQLAGYAFMFVIPAQIPFGDTVMLGMTPLEGPEPGSTIVLDLDGGDGQQGLIGCLQNHLLQLYALGPKYREFAGSHFPFEMQSAIAEKAHDCLTRTMADGRQHHESFIAHRALYVISSLPVAIGRAPEWYGAQYGGFTRLVMQWLRSEPFQDNQCDMLCAVTFGQDPATWVSLTIVPTDQGSDPVEIMSVDFLNASEKATLALDFDRHGRVV